MSQEITNPKKEQPEVRRAIVIDDVTSKQLQELSDCKGRNRVRLVKQYIEESKTEAAERFKSLLNNDKVKMCQILTPGKLKGSKMEATKHKYIYNQIRRLHNARGFDGTGVKQEDKSVTHYQTIIDLDNTRLIILL